MSFEGTWRSTFGKLKLIQNGTRIHGLYRDLGVIEAEQVSEVEMAGTFTNTGHTGRLRFVRSDGDEFVGKWTWGSADPGRPDLDGDREDDEWHGTRLSREVETPHGAWYLFDGEWDSTYGRLHLHQNNDRLYGLYRDLGVIEGERIGEENAFRGRFTNTGHKGWFRFTLNGDGTAFSGEYGWRDGEVVDPWDATRIKPERPRPEVRAELKNIRIPVAPGHRNIVFDASAVGSSGDPEVIVSAARTRQALFNDPIEIHDVDHLGNGTFNAVLPADIRDAAGRDELVCGEEAHVRIKVLVDGAVKLIRDFEFRLPDPVVLVNIGDSYAAGVGTGQYDLDEEKGRSSISGQHRAMTEFASLHPAVVINLAVGGDNLNPDIIKTNGREGKQLRWLDMRLDELVARRVLSEKRVDFLIVSAGGNDTYGGGLADIIARLLISVFDPNTSVFFRGMRRDLAANLSDFAKDLNRFHDHLQTDPTLRPARVIYCTYPDSTRDENGNHTKPPSVLMPSWNRVTTTLSGDDLAFAYKFMINDLNERIRQFYDLDKDRYIPNDVERISRLHGYPSRSSYFVRMRLVEQLRLFRDSFHPNVLGYTKIYYEPIAGILADHEPDETRASQSTHRDL